MRKLKYVLVGCLAAVLIISISALPFGISAIMDSSNHNKSHLSDMDTIQLNLNGDTTELSPFQKLQLVGCGVVTEVDESQALLTPDQVQQYISENLQRYTDAGLLIGEVSDLKMGTCVPMLYYDANNMEHYSVFWIVELAARSPDQRLELLVDDDTGGIYQLHYLCNAESATDDVSSYKNKVEHFATCFFDALKIEYRIEDCYPSDDTTWYLRAICSDGEQEVLVELYFFGNGFDCSISS